MWFRFVWKVLTIFVIYLEFSFSFGKSFPPSSLTWLIKGASETPLGFHMGISHGLKHLSEDRLIIVLRMRKYRVGIAWDTLRY